MLLQCGTVSSYDSNTADSDATIRDWLREIMRHGGFDATSLARQAGLPQSTVTRILNGDVSHPTVRTLSLIAAKSPVAVPKQVQIRLDRATPSAREQGVNVSANFSDGIPVWGVFPVRRDREFHVNSVPLVHLPRPASFAPGRRLVAFYAPDETMAPRWRMGEPVLVDLLRQATTGSFALVKLTDGEDPNAEEVYLFRRYDGRRGGAIQLAAADDPYVVENVPLARVLEVRKVLDWEDIITGR